MRNRILVLLLAVAMGSLAVNASLPYAAAAPGGPTGMGYEWTDSISPAPRTPFQWMDISASGTRLASVSACDDCIQPAVPIGFSFPFYGSGYATVNVNSNGTLQFADTAHHWGPGRVPTDDFSGPVLLLFWSDWDPRSRGNIYAQTIGNWPGSNGQRAFVVQWDNVESWDCDTGNNATFQAVLLEGGSFIYQYLDTELGDIECDRGADMTVGIQQGSQGCFVTYANLYAGLPNGTAISWQPSASTCTQSVEPTATPPGEAELSPAPELSGEPPEAPDTGSGPASDTIRWLPTVASLVLLVAGLGLIALSGSRLRT